MFPISKGKKIDWATSDKKHVQLLNFSDMVARTYNSQFQKQWSKFMYYFFNYLPVKYEANPREQKVRKFIWGFKNGNNRCRLKAAELIARQIFLQFGEQTKGIVFCCIPASSAKRNEERYKEFSAEVCRLTGVENAFEHIHVEGSRLAIHENRTGKSVQNVQIINFNQSFFANKKVIVFDDIFTKGVSYARFACVLESFGASVLGGYFLGRTLFK